MANHKFGVIGSGSWATALVKILTDRKQTVGWWVRNEKNLQHLQQRNHNPSYLSSVYFDTSLLKMSTDVSKVIKESTIVVIAVPSAYVEESIGHLKPEIWKGKKIVSAIK